MIRPTNGICQADKTDYYALRALIILKTFKIRPIRATFSCFLRPKVVFSHAGM